MRTTRRCLAVLALAALATSASAQNGKPGHAVCFGDGTGTPCPSHNPGRSGHGCENSALTGGGLMWADGVAMVSRDTMRLYVKDLPTRTTVIFMQAEGCRNEGMGFPFGDGLMCMGRSMTKLGAFRTFNGTAQFPPPVSSLSLSEFGSLPVTGGERFYQILYRDPDRMSTGAGSNFNLTNAWSIEWAK